MTADCGTCKFNALGKCYRFPPIPMLSAGQVRPNAVAGQWCGEYVAARAALRIPIEVATGKPLRIPVEFDEAQPPVPRKKR